MCRRLKTAVLALSLLLCAFPQTGNAADWVFRRSYYSHNLPPEVAARYPVPESYSAYRPAVVSPYPGFSISGVQRFNRVNIQSGQSFDSTLMRSNNVRIQP